MFLLPRERGQVRAEPSELCDPPSLIPALSSWDKGLYPAAREFCGKGYHDYVFYM
jgi:hypothetical protein